MAAPTSFFNVVYVALVCQLISAASEYRGPVLLWSSDKDLKVLNDSNDLIVDITSLIQSGVDFVETHPQGISAIFVDDDFTSERASSAYSDLATTLSQEPYFKAWQFSNHLLSKRLKNSLLHENKVEIINSESITPQQVQKKKVLIINITNKPNPVQFIVSFIDQLNQSSYFVMITGPVSTSSSDSAVKRRLQETPDEPPKPSANMINIQPRDFPGALIFAVFIFVILIGLSCLADINTPESYEDKTLVLNKEY